jgi:hypothetical protein
MSRNLKMNSVSCEVLMDNKYRLPQSVDISDICLDYADIGAICAIDCNACAKG